MAELTSPMAGKVQEFFVKVGDKVEADDPLAIIE